MIVRRARATAADHPAAVDGCLAALLAALVLPATLGGADAPGALGAGGGVDGMGWLWFVGVHVPLVWRRRAPDAVFWTVAGIAGLSALDGAAGAFLIVAALFALYTVARHRPAQHVWPAAGAIALATGLGWWLGDTGWSALIGHTSALVVVTVTGAALRTRRAYLVERARLAERELGQQTNIAVAAEREQIAREVHDIVAHNLAVMVALADGASTTARTSPADAADMMAKVSTTGRSALSELRRLVGLLRDAPAGLSPLPGVDDLDQLVEQVRAVGLRVAMVQDGPAVAPAPAGIGLTVYRIVQEALTNTLKHAGPGASAEVRLHCSATGVEVEITDDGPGRTGDLPGGHGLVGIAERAAAYGGRVDAGPLPGRGWRVCARLPLDSAGGQGVS